MIEIPEEGDVSVEFRLVVNSWGQYEKCERQIMRFVARALQNTFDSYELYAEDGRQILFDPFADDGHHAGHDPEKAIIILGSHG